MEDIYPEIALKQPKADPRTVFLYERYFLESSSDHAQKFSRNSFTTTNTTATATTSTENCDKSKNVCKCAKATTTAYKCFTITISKSTSASAPATSISASASSSSSLFLLPTTSSLPSWSTSLLSSTLVNFSKSCHFNCSFINNYLYKSQKKQLIFFLLFIWCAIFLQATQALPAHRISTSGQKLILHTNVYREHYHQQLLQEQRQHKQRQQLIQLQLQEQQRLKQEQTTHQQQKVATPSSIFYHQQQVQKNHLIAPIQTFRRHPQPLQHHHHHLHQRAAPGTSPHHFFQQYKMSYCNVNKVYQNLYHQMNASMLYIKQLCANYLRDRGNETFEDMAETWKLISLESRNPNRKEVLIENELHKKIHDFYLNLHTFDQLIDYASQDTNDNKTKIEHGEEISIDKIIKFLQAVKAEIKFNMQEAESLLEILEIEKPNLADNTMTFNANIGRRVRDFLIIKNLIEEFEHVVHLVQNYCENNESE